MDNSFFAYLQQLELMAFFSGYPLLYTLVFYLNGFSKSTTRKQQVLALLPRAYGLVGILYLGLQLRNLYPNYSVENIRQTTEQPLLMIWGILAILFWVPALSRKHILSLLHSLVFFLLLAKDLFLHSISSRSDTTAIKTEMKIYTDSLLLNTGCFIFLLALYAVFIFIRLRRNRHL
ncbi:MAG: hypothetical protein ABIR30_13805 [Chitinophagaceae bacterium]